MKRNGFTLVEIIVVLAIMAILGLVLTQIFYSTLRGGSKAQVLSVVKQNGQSAVEAMDKTIRSADKVVNLCPSPFGAHGASVETGLDCTTNCGAIVILKNKVYTRFLYVPADSSDTNNGYIVMDTLTSPPECLNSTFGSNLSVLTDKDSKTGVSIESGIFSLNRLAGTEDVVTISFSVKPGSGIQSAYPDIVGTPFKTAVKLRSQ